MQEEIFNKKQTFRYLIWTFGIAYLIQAAVAVMYANGLTIAYQLVMMAMMFVPLLGTLLSGYKLRNIGWRPRFRGNLKPILIAWLSPAVLTAIGAAVYFLLFDFMSLGRLYPVLAHNRPECRITHAHALVMLEALTEVFKINSRVSWRRVKRDYAAFDRLGRFIAGDVAEVFIIKTRQALA